MLKLLVILFIIKLYVRINIYKSVHNVFYVFEKIWGLLVSFFVFYRLCKA